MVRILVAAPQSAVLQLMVSSLEKRECEVLKANSLEALRKNLQKSPDLLVLDAHLVGDALPQLSRAIQEQNPGLSVLLLSDPQRLSRDRELLAGRIAGVLAAPFDVGAFEDALIPLTEQFAIPLRNDAGPAKNFVDLDSFPSVKKHPGMKKAAGLIRNVAETDITVFISGESGVGKEVFAKALHSLSKRKNEKLVGLNCASVPPTLLEAELFGSERGAFTGAMARRIGKFELAQKGTLLLDEVSEMDLNLQAKILRVIQEKELYRVGGEEKISLDVRLVATTNRDLRAWVKEGHFREDLFYRLNVISITVPPLRERLEDVPVLAEHFIRNYNRESGKSLALTMDAVSQLCQYNWPGNIRELENILTRTACLAKGNVIKKINFDEGHDPQFPKNVNPLFTGTLDEMERQMIRYALEMHDGNRVRAADQLGVSVRTLRNKLRQYREEAAAQSAGQAYIASEASEAADDATLN